MAQEDISFTDLIASSVHDMKNSLAVQVDMLERIADQARERGDHETAMTLGSIIYESSRMNTNLIQLLSLYKLGNAIYPMDVNEYAIRDMLEELVLQCASIMNLKGITVSLDCDHDCYWYLDRDLVTGALMNALNNAYKYTKDKIRVAARIENNCLELRVEDNGTGYPPSMLMDDAVSDNKGVNFSSGSTGLGFYFSSRVAQMHKNGKRQGSLAIENGGVYGGGCFVVRIP